MESPDCGMFLVVCHGQMGQGVFECQSWDWQWHMKEIGLENGSESQLPYEEYDEEFPEMKDACSRNTG